MLETIGAVAGGLNAVSQFGKAFGIGGSSGSSKRAALDEINRQNYWNQKQFDFAEKQLAQQKEFAQMGIRWRAADAKAAGFHPLAVLGATGASSSPISVMPSTSPVDASYSRDMGQDLSRASLATMDFVDRQQLKASAALSLENQSLQNELLRAQIHKLSSDQVGPPMASAMSPAPVSADVPGGFGTVSPLVPVEVQPIPATNPQSPSSQAGAFPDVRWQRTARGFMSVLPEHFVGEPEPWNVDFLSWAMRNRLDPILYLDDRSKVTVPPDDYLKAFPRADGGVARGWKYDIINQEWLPDFSKGVIYPIGN